MQNKIGRIRNFFSNHSRTHLHKNQISATQFSMSSASDVCDVVMGFDFGTSSTKVVLQTPYHNNQRAFAVDFDEAAHASNKYLLPSILWVSQDGTTSLKQLPGYRKYSRFKLDLIEGPDSKKYDESLVLATAYLANAFRFAREWFLNSQKTLYSEYTLRWAVNVGLPSENYANKLISESYQRIASSAWRLSLHDSITLNDAKKVMDCKDKEEELDDRDGADITCIPEVAAEVVCYARSDMRREGLHVLVDVGAGTLDICSFILHEKEGDDHYELLTASVDQLGAMILHEARINEIINNNLSPIFSNGYDWINKIPDNVNEYVVTKDVSTIDKLKNVDNKHLQQCCKVLKTMIVKLKTKRDPNSRVWKNMLPIFIAGGGSNMQHYKDLISTLNEWLKEFYIECCGIENRSLQHPQNLIADIDAKEYHRLAVAVGLSFPDTDIGEVARPEDIPDVALKPDKDFTDKMITKNNL